MPAHTNWLWFTKKNGLVSCNSNTGFYLLPGNTGGPLGLVNIYRDRHFCEFHLSYGTAVEKDIFHVFRNISEKIKIILCYKFCRRKKVVIVYLWKEITTKSSPSPPPEEELNHILNLQLRHYKTVSKKEKKISKY